MEPWDVVEIIKNRVHGENSTQKKRTVNWGQTWLVCKPVRVQGLLKGRTEAE